MRGIRIPPALPASSSGITPAHAGNTRCSGSSARWCGDHPRACGEYVSTFTSCVRLAGSPPRMRGIPKLERDRQELAGITPAHAGNTITASCRRSWMRDHPRACGEYYRYFPSLITGKGSPPRMRGIPGVPQISASQCGITPAHAGNTFITSLHHCDFRDHPRACGEYRIFPAALFHGTGSPPRMRGIRRLLECRNRHLGITPAHAGNTEAR